MAKEEKVLTGQDLWGALKGKKEEVKEEVPIKFGDVEGRITVRFVDVDVIQNIVEEYEDKKPKKPMAQVTIKDRVKNIPVPNDEERYEFVNNIPENKKKIKKWEEKCQPIEKEKKIRLAYEFIIPEERPSENIKEGMEILEQRLRFMDIVNIVNKGFEINSISEAMGEQEEDF